MKGCVVNFNSSSTTRDTYIGTDIKVVNTDINQICFHTPSPQPHHPSPSLPPILTFDGGT